MKKNGFLALALIGVTVLCTMQFNSCCQSKPTQISQRDTTYLNILTHKANELKQHYQKENKVLQIKNDSLQSLVHLQKSKLKIIRLKADTLQWALREYLNPMDSLPIKQRVVSPLFEDYIALQIQEQGICDSTTCQLETMLANKEEQIHLCAQAFNAVQDLSAQQQAQIKLLEQNLNTAYKQQKRKSISNRLLASGLMIVSGVATTLLINQARP